MAAIVPDVLTPYITAGDDGIRLNPRGSDGISLAVLVLPEEKYPAWRAFFPAGLDKGLENQFGASRRLFFLVNDMPKETPSSFIDNGVSLFTSGYPLPAPVGETWSEPPKELPVIPYADVERLMGQKPCIQSPVSFLPEGMRKYNEADNCDVLALDTGLGNSDELDVIEPSEKGIVSPWEREIGVNMRFEDCGAKRAFNRFRHKFTDEGNACRFEDECKGWLIYDKSSEKWFAWETDCWVQADERLEQALRFVGRSVDAERGKWKDPDKNDTIPREFVAHATHSASRRAQNDMLAMAKANMTVDFRKDSNPALLACRNGIFNSKTGDFYPLEDCERFKEEYPTCYIDAEYTEGARSEKWIHHLETVMDDNVTDGLDETERTNRRDETVKDLLRLFGYALYTGNPERIFVWFYGDGRNGKSTTLDVLSAVLGSQARNPSLTQLFTTKTDTPAPSIAAALPCRLAVFSEASGSVPMDEAAVKEITGETETERFRGMHKDNVKIPIYCLPIATTNECPTFDKDADFALLSRLRFVPFNHKFNGENRTIKDELKAEKDAIFSMMVDECRKYLTEGLMPVPACAQVTKEELMIGPDRYRFLTERLERSNDMMSNKQVAEEYLKWCREQYVTVKTVETKGGDEILHKSEKDKLFKGLKMLGYSEARNHNERGFKVRVRGKKESGLTSY